ncbi:MAG: hypothetical protein OCC49_15285 [Fibrobacterales bacterium]
MNVKTLIKTAALTAMVGVGTIHAADASMGGQIPLNSSVIIYPERLLDFSADATLLKMAEVVVTNNAPGFRINVSFDAAAVAFSGTNILTDLALDTDGSVGWGAGLFNSNGGVMDAATGGIAAGGACGAAVELVITAAADVNGGLTGCVKAAGAAAGNYVDLATSPIILEGAANAFAAQTSPTTNASIELQGSWVAGTDVTTAALLAGTYSATMTVTLESSY